MVVVVDKEEVVVGMVGEEEDTSSLAWVVGPYNHHTLASLLASCMLGRKLDKFACNDEDK